MADPVKLHRCSIRFMKTRSHPCWRVEKALIDMGVEYETVTGPMRRSKRTAIAESTGQNLYPAIRFEDGSWYREESADMERTIRAGRLHEQRGRSVPPESALRTAEVPPADETMS